MKISKPKPKDMVLVIVGYPIGGNCAVIGPTDMATVHKLADFMQLIGKDNYFICKIRSIEEFFQHVPEAFGKDVEDGNATEIVVHDTYYQLP